MDGFLLCEKSIGISSNHLVQNVKKQLKLKKVGHLGTLDPMAEGLLILAINKATKFSSYFLEADKKYLAKINFAFSTNTDDALGEVLHKSKIIPKKKDIKLAIESLQGISFQKPPYFSSLKFKGKRLYKYAREGILIEKPKRKIEIFSIKNIEITKGKCSFLVHCSKGTYIRSIARDLGESLGCHAHLSYLKRVSQGNFCLKNKTITQNLKDIIPIEEAFLNYKKIKLNVSDTKIFVNGGQVLNKNKTDGLYRVYDSKLNFRGLGKVIDNELKLKQLV